MNTLSLRKDKNQSAKHGNYDLDGMKIQRFELHEVQR